MAHRGHTVANGGPPVMARVGVVLHSSQHCGLTVLLEGSVTALNTAFSVRAVSLSDRSDHPS